MSNRVLVVDDDPAVLSSLRRALSLDGYDVMAAQSGEAALAMAQSSQPDLVVLDVLLPGIDGYTVCGYLRQMGRIPIIMLTAKDTVPDRIVGLDRGADDYVVKPFVEGELSARIRAVLRRTQPDDHQDVLSYADLRLDVVARQAYRRGEPLCLSCREYDLLHYFMRHPRHALSRDQICQQVWGYPFQGESNFVDVAVKELRKKIEGQGGRRLIQTVRGFGYALRES